MSYFEELFDELSDTLEQDYDCIRHAEKTVACNEHGQRLAILSYNSACDNIVLEMPRGCVYTERKDIITEIENLCDDPAPDVFEEDESF